MKYLANSWQRVLRLFKGDDVFISYSRADATVYALGLADELTKRGLACYIDQWGSPPGAQLPVPVLNALRRSTMLVLIGTPNAATSAAVQLEVETFLKTGRTIIPVSLEGTIEKSPIFLPIRGLSISCELTESLTKGKASEHIITRIINAEGFVSKSKQLRRIFVLTTACTGVVMFSGASISYYFADKARIAIKGTQLEIAGTAILRDFNGGSEEINTLITAITKAEELKAITARTAHLVDYPAISPWFALQSVLENIHEWNIFRTRSASLRTVMASPDWATFAVVEGDQTVTGKSILRLLKLSGDEVLQWPLPEGGVRQMLFSMDGSHIAILSATVDVGIVVFDRQGNQIQNHKHIQEWAFTKHSDHIAAITSDGQALLLDTNGDLKTDLALPNSRVLKIAVDNHGDLIAGVASDESVHVWDSNGNHVISCKCPNYSPSYVAINTTAKRIVSASNKGICIFDIKGRLMRQWGTAGVSDIQVSPSGDLFATVVHSSNDRIRVWDFDGKLRTDFATAGRTVFMRFDSTGSRIITAGFDGSLRLWDVSGEFLFRLSGHRGRIQSIDQSTDGRLLLSSSQDSPKDSTARLWDLGQRGTRLKASSGELVDIAFSSSNEMFTLDDDANLRLWDITGKQLNQWSIPVEGYLSAGRISPNGRYVLVVSSGRNSGTLLQVVGNKLHVIRQVNSNAIGVSFRDERRFMIAEHLGGATDLYDVTKEEAINLEGLQGWYNTSFSSNDDRLATVGLDGTIRIWDNLGKQLTWFDTRQGQALDVSYSPDGRLIASAGADGTIALWDTVGQKVGQCYGHSGHVLAVRFSPDGERLASLGVDGTVRLWDYSGRQLVEVASPSDPPIHDASSGSYGHRGFGFSKDGRYLAASGRNGEVRIWNIEDLEGTIKRAKSWLENYLRKRSIDS